MRGNNQQNKHQIEQYFDEQQSLNQQTRANFFQNQTLQKRLNKSCERKLIISSANINEQIRKIQGDFNHRGGASTLNKLMEGDGHPRQRSA